MNLTDIVGKAAPLLASALGTPVAGLGVGLIANLFGADPKDTQDVVAKILSDPEADAKLKKLEYDHKEALENVQATNYKTEVDDRKSARELQSSLVQNHTLQSWVPTILAVGFLINYALMQFYVVSHQSSANDIISARFQDVLIMIISYYFGSSHKHIEK
ncbi:MAG: hypothetical protein WC753_04695 [Candidatus Gracilibacteria bacterium]|jgi:hypothetical protein